MAIYVYSLAEERPEEFAKMMPPNDLIGVWNEKISYGSVAFEPTGRLKLNLPDEVVKKLNHGLLKLEPKFRRVWSDTNKQDAGQLEIERIDIVAIPSYSETEE